MIEDWKDIVDYPNYQVSNLGNVKSKERYTRQRKGFSLRKERILKQNKDHKGYMQVILYNENGYKHFKVHRLVADAFITKIDGKNHINHIDGNKEHNFVDNLEWCTIQENNKHYREVLRECN